MTSANKNIKVILNIKPGQVSIGQKAAWRKFWRRLINEARNDNH